MKRKLSTSKHAVKMRSYRERYSDAREKERERNRKWRQANRIKCLEKDKARKRKRHVYICAVCDGSFTPRGRAITCSKVCSNKRYCERMRGWRSRNPDKVRSLNRNWRFNNSDYVKEKDRQYRDINRGSIKNRNQKYNEQRMAALLIVRQLTNTGINALIVQPAPIRSLSQHPNAILTRVKLTKPGARQKQNIRATRYRVRNKNKHLEACRIQNYKKAAALRIVRELEKNSIGALLP